MFRSRIKTPWMRAYALSFLVLCVCMVNARSATAAMEWTPSSVLANTQSTVFAVEMTDGLGVTFRFRCFTFSINGTLGNNLREWNITPGLGRCPIFVAGTLVASDENGTTAGLKIPAGGGIKVPILPACKVKIAPQTIMTNGNYTLPPNANGLERPAKWAIDNTVNLTAQEPAQCFDNPETLTAKVKADLDVMNHTNNTVIRVNP